MKISKVYKDFFIDKSRYSILYGGAGSGKSYVACQKILTRVLNEKNQRILIVRKVARTLRESVFSLFKMLINDENLKNIFKINLSNMVITNTINNNELIFFGLDDVEKLKSIAGISSIWIEEATELKKEDLDQLDLRLRNPDVNYMQIIITFNPVSATHWIKKIFFDSLLKDTFILKNDFFR